MEKVYTENAEALTLCDEVQRLTRRRDNLNVEIHDKREKMRLVCTHAETKVEDSYVGGGYLDREQFIKTRICIVCGKELDKNNLRWI
jgi:transposase